MSKNIKSKYANHKNFNNDNYILSLLLKCFANITLSIPLNHCVINEAMSAAISEIIIVQNTDVSPIETCLNLTNVF
jgi:hypothetical protein